MNPIYIYSLDFWFYTQNFGQYENDYIINFDILLLFGIIILILKYIIIN